MDLAERLMIRLVQIYQGFLMSGGLPKIAARRLLLLILPALPFFSGCAVATVTVAVGSAAVSVATTTIGVATDIAVGTIKGAATVTGAVIDAASGPDEDDAPKLTTNGSSP
ncbi:MAG TPA: hypothetical protein VF104_07030 [Burkholderiales bacterium]